MKLYIVIMAALAPLVLCYDEAFDKMDVDKILADDNLFQSYVNCMLDKGPCDKEHAEDFKKLLPEVIETVCEKCSPIQKKNVKKFVKALTDKKPDEFKAFVEKYDPTHEHEKAFTAFVLAA